MAKRCLQLAFDAINERLAEPLTERDVEITDIVYLPEGEYNTRALLKPKVGSQYQEAITFEYDRLNIRHALGYDTVSVLPNNQRLLSDYLPAINDKYNLDLSNEDIVDGVIELVPPPFFITLQMREDNPAFYGELQILVSNEEKSLRRLVEQINGASITLGLNGKSDDHRIQMNMKYYGINATDIHLELLMLTRGGEIHEGFTTAINYISNITWEYQDHPVDYNLYGAKVLYNGLTKDCESAVNTKYEYVAIIELHDEYNIRCCGKLILHYNVN